MSNEILKQECISEYVAEKPTGKPRNQELSTWAEKQKNIEAFLKEHPEYIGFSDDTRFVNHNSK